MAHVTYNHRLWRHTNALSATWYFGASTTRHRSRATCEPLTASAHRRFANFPLIYGRLLLCRTCTSAPCFRRIVDDDLEVLGLAMVFNISAVTSPTFNNRSRSYVSGWCMLLGSSWDVLQTGYILWSSWFFSVGQRGEPPPPPLKFSTKRGFSIFWHIKWHVFR